MRKPKRRTGQAYNEVPFTPARREAAWDWVRAQRSVYWEGPVTFSTTLDRSEALDLLTRRAGYLFRPLEWPAHDEPSTNLSFAGWKPMDEAVLGYVLEGRGKRMISVESRWGIPGDRIACGERYRRLDGGGVEYEADFPPDARPRTGYWKPARRIPALLTRLVLEIEDVEPRRIHDAARRAGRVAEDGLRELWNRKYARWGRAWERDPWVWAIRYARLSPV